MRAKYLGQGVIDNYKGVSLKPGCEFEVTDAMLTVVLSAPTLFQVLDEIEPEEASGQILDKPNPFRAAMAFAERQNGSKAEPQPPRKRGRPRKDA